MFRSESEDGISIPSRCSHSVLDCGLCLGGGLFGSLGDEKGPFGWRSFGM